MRIARFSFPERYEHIAGDAESSDEERTAAWSDRLLQDMVSAYEESQEKPWHGQLPADFRDKLIQGIVAFEIPLSRIEGKFKLSQNRPAADVRGVFNALSRSTDDDSRAIAQMMLTEYEL